MNRRNLLKGAAGLGAAALAGGVAGPALAQNSRASTLRFVPQANLSALDPIWTTATVTSNHGYYIFDTLFAVDANNRVQPQMAEGHEVADGGRLWRFRLREGLRFHDGTPVRSADCIASVKRWASRDPFGQLITGITEEWKVVDDRNFELRLNRPFPALLEALGKAEANVPFIMPERLAKTDGATAITEMVGSGPYRFVASEFNSGSRAVYTKFDGYVPCHEAPSAAAGAKIAHFQRIEWDIITDPS
ncbi:ABC transporter substrate-binding protein, partial [Roseomonas sp. DSM 102946]|nr:ABC transporter substrate-binding protein [Roseomonas sp. DSM 102946]